MPNDSGAEQQRGERHGRGSGERAGGAEQAAVLDGAAGVRLAAALDRGLDESATNA